MESHTNFYDYGPFSDQNPPQKGSGYDNSYDSGVLEGWNLEDYHYEPGLDVSQFQPVLEFESENGTVQLNSTTDIGSSRSGSHTAIGNAGNSHSNSIWVPQEASEAYNWLPNSDANAVYTKFCQEINNNVWIATSQRATAFLPSYNVQPPLMGSPSFITFQPLCNEQVKPPVCPPQQGFELLPDRESRENPLYSNSLYVPPTPLLT